MGKDERESTTDEAQGFITGMISDIIYSPVNMLLLVFTLFLIYKIFASRSQNDDNDKPPPTPQLPKMKKQDFTLEQLRKYDGKTGDGRILFAVNNSVIDATKGSRFYGPGEVYSCFAGRDISRALATYEIHALRDEYDDMLDFDDDMRSELKEWETQMCDQYERVGKLLKPGEKATIYPDED